MVPMNKSRSRKVPFSKFTGCFRNPKEKLLQLLKGTNAALYLLFIYLLPVPAAVSQEILKISPNPDGDTTEENGAPKEHALDAGLIFQLSTLNDEIFARDVEGQQINWLEAMPRGFARRNAFGALDVSAGGYMIEQMGSLLADYLERTQAFTLMASVTCFDGDIADEARIISLSVGERGMKLVQRGAQIMFRTEGMDGNRVCEALPGERRHIGITYADRTLHYVVNGLLIAAETLDEKISIPNAATLSFGEVAQSMSSRWNGIIEGVAVYDRALTLEELAALDKAEKTRIAEREPIPQLRVRAVLRDKSHVPTPQELSPYTQSLAVFLYEVREVLSGQYEEEQLHVAHWCVLDRDALPYKDTKIGSEHVLLLEPFEVHPYLESEPISTDVVEDFSLLWFYDAGGRSLDFEVARISEFNVAAFITKESVEHADVLRDLPTPFTGRERAARAAAIRDELASARKRLQPYRSEHARWLRAVDPFYETLSEKLEVMEGAGASYYIGRDGFGFHPGNVRYLAAAYPALKLGEEALLKAERDDFPEFNAALRAVESIIEFNAALKSRNIDLLVVLIPGRAHVMTDESAEFGSGVATRLFPFYDLLNERLLRADVEALNIHEAMVDAYRTGDGPVYLRSDMHWAPSGIQVAAKKIGKRLSRYDFIRDPEGLGRRFVEESLSINFGPGTDFRDELDADGQLYLAESLDVICVRHIDGSHVEPDMGSPVLLMGDSFVEFFSGESADLASYIAAEIGMSIARIDGDAAGPRVPRMLSMKGENYIRGKRVVILAFLESYMFKPSTRWTRFGEQGGLANSMFELWSGDRPVRWRRENANVRKVELLGGAIGVELIPPNGNKHAVLVQTFELPDSALGAQFRLTLKGRSDEVNMLSCNISYDAGREIVAMVDHPGDGTWHTLRTDFVIPAQANRSGVNSFECVIALGRGAAMPVQIDDVCLVEVGERE